jgi:hypothetical protein
MTSLYVLISVFIQRIRLWGESDTHTVGSNVVFLPLHSLEYRTLRRLWTSTCDGCCDVRWFFLRQV